MLLFQEEPAPPPPIALPKHISLPGPTRYPLGFVGCSNSEWASWEQELCRRRISPKVKSAPSAWRPKNR
eukprot:843816-Rhodomonas_salina.2